MAGLIPLLLVVSVAQTSGEPIQETPRRAIRPYLELRDFALSLSSLSTVEVTVGPRALVRASEDAMNTDLNGDGDQSDRVAHSAELATGFVANLGLACSEPSFALDPAQPGHAVALVSEHSQGGQDLNGDGDHADNVFFDLDLEGASSRNSELALSGFDAALVDGTWAALKVGEAAQGAGDLNGDGVVGNALFGWDLSGSDAPMDAGTGLSGLQAAHQSYFLFSISESADGVDRNGDGDTNDDVLHAYQASTGNITNTALNASAVAKGPHSVLMVSESGQQEDLNGDGDLLDNVPHVFNIDGGGIVNTQVAMHTPTVFIGHGGERAARTMALGDEGVAFHVSENKQGNVDLNGDGDALDDDILFVHVFATGETRNLALSVFDFELTGGLLAMQVGSYYSGLEAQIHDLSANTTWDLGVLSLHGVSQSSFVIRENWVALMALENGVDHTGDGDGNDRYLLVADAVRRNTIDTGLALTSGNYLEWTLVFHDSGALTALAFETTMDADLNGDGDTDDQVAHLLYPALGLVLNSRASAYALMPGYRQNYPFIADESGDGVDHNGDGDAQDNVLRAMRLRLR